MIKDNEGLVDLPGNTRMQQHNTWIGAIIMHGPITCWLSSIFGHMASAKIKDAIQLRKAFKKEKGEAAAPGAPPLQQPGVDIPNSGWRMLLQKAANISNVFMVIASLHAQGI